MTQTPSRRTFLTASVAAGGVSLVGVPGTAAADGGDGSDRPPLAQRPSRELESILRELDQRRIDYRRLPGPPAGDGDHDHDHDTKESFG
jgi:hypothetical protein